MSDYAIVPYTEVDGIKNYSDSFIKSLYARMVKDGTANSVFAGVGITNEDDFLAMTKTEGLHFHVLYCGGNVSGIFWLNRLQYRWAQIHFCFFKEAWGKETVPLGNYALRQLLEMGSAERHIFDMLVGIIPSRNRVGLAFVQKCGGIVTGTLPRGVYNPETKDSEEATIISLTRESVR